MVVLAVAVTSRSGKLLLARQYVDMSRIRIEGLLAAFPKLIGTEKQHTYVETDSVRYVYQPVESLYVLLMTNKTSNIVEDLETLRLLGKVLPEYSPRYGVVDEAAVMETSFELINSFDEVIDWGGYRENVNLQQVISFTQMHSNEEILAKRIQELKIKEANDLMQSKANMLKHAKGGDDKLGAFGNELGRFMEKTGFGGLATDLGFGGGGKNNTSVGGFAGGISSASYQQSSGMGGGMPMGGGGGMPGMGSGMGGMGSGMGYDQGRMNPSGGGGAPSMPVASAAPVGKGMTLGKAKKQDNFLEQMRAEGEMVDIVPSMLKKPTVGGGKSAAVGGGAGVYAPAVEAVHLSVVETLSLVMMRDGGMEKLEVKGDLKLTISDPEKAALRIGINLGTNKKFQLKPNPKIDKTLFSQEGKLGLKGDPSQKFPVDKPLDVLRWRMASTDEDDIPLTVSCWPSDGGSDSQVNLEYELVRSQELRNVVISIPVPSAGGKAPEVGDIDGEWDFNARTSTLEWMIPVVDSNNSNGSFEFTAPAADPSSFFPVSVSFSSKTTYSMIGVSGVVNALTGDPIKFSQDVSFSTEKFNII